MLRSIFLLGLFAIVLVFTVGAPFTGILGWTWLALMTPHKLASGFIADWPLNLVLAGVTGFAWLVSSESKRLPMTAVTWLLLAFMALMTLTTFFALNPHLAWDRWDKVVKIILLGLMVAILATEPKRVHALAWVIVLSLGFFGVKGGLFTIIRGGSDHVLGPPDSSIADNNYLALALCMTLPFMYYLYLHSSHRLTRIGLAIALGLTAIGILGTYSRGGIVGLAIMSLFLWWKSKSRVLIAITAIVVATAAFQFMPEKWTDRVGTLQNMGGDLSFQNRVDAWKVAYHIGVARPLLGGGFGATEDPDVYRKYSEGASMFRGSRTVHEITTARAIGNLTPSQINQMFPADYTGAHAVHSIYLQVLADHGFAGLALFLSLLIASWMQLSSVRRATKNEPQLAWAHDIASMMQVSMTTYFVSGAAVSMCYYDLPYLIIGIGIALRALTTASTTGVSPVVARPERGGFAY